MNVRTSLNASCREGKVCSTPPPPGRSVVRSLLRRTRYCNVSSRTVDSRIPRELNVRPRTSEDVMRGSRVVVVVVALLSWFAATVAAASDAGQVKTVKGTANVERQGKKLPATVGLKVHEGDAVST